jgi:hypothetical protein
MERLPRYAHAPATQCRFVTALVAGWSTSRPGRRRIVLSNAKPSIAAVAIVLRDDA